MLRRNWDTTEKQQKKNITHATVALELPLPIVCLLGVFPSYPFCPTTAIIRCHLDSVSLNGVQTPAFSWRAGVEYTQAGFLLKAVGLDSELTTGTAFSMKPDWSGPETWADFSF